MKLLLKITIFTFLFVFAFNTNAQMPTSIDGVDIQANIDSPGPEESVEVSIESFSFDLSSASIVWIADGKTQGQGIGMKKIMIKAGKVGVPVVVTAIIKASGGREIRKSIVLKAGSVDIIWETRGYNPPFFNGKLPFVYQNTIKLIAVPRLSTNGVNELDPKTLVYKWKSGGKWIDNAQGYGKQSVDIVSGNIPKPLDIEVEVYNREQTQDIVGSIILEPKEPSLSFYEESSLYGVLFNKSLSGKTPLVNSEMKVRAVPYGFNIYKNDANTYIWSINSVEQPDLSKNQSIVVRTKGDTEGSTDINLDIRNMVDILQGAQAGFTVYFSKKQTQTPASVTF